MSMSLLVCTDLDRTLLPNGGEPESAGARTWFHRLAALEEVTLAYVTGRDRNRVEEAIEEYGLPRPDFVLGDVGSSIYVCNPQEWHLWSVWQDHIRPDWNGFTHGDLAQLLADFSALQLQEESKQNTYKLSYYASMHLDYKVLLPDLHKRLRENKINASLIWSIDAPAHRGLLDILPACATKCHAVEFLMDKQGYSLANTVFAGDSGNDLPVLVSPIPSILVRNASPDVKQEALHLVNNVSMSAPLYLARGGFRGMNGNYAAGIMEGIAHYHPEIITLLES
jgi:sucrose-6F-phosphate phosphohydrolase